MLRIHFTDGDREPIALSTAPDPMWETLLSLHVLRGNGAGSAHTWWRSQVQANMTPDMQALASLAPPSGYSPDFLTPWCAGEGIERGLGELMATPRARLLGDLRRLVAQQGRCSAAAGLVRGDSGALRGLAQAVRAYHRLALAPYWERIEAATAPVLSPGATGLPAALRSQAQWRGSVLEIAYPLDRDLYLRGRTLHVVPSFFCRRYPITFADPARPPVLLHPAQALTAAPDAAERSAHERRALARLLGHTRALVLEAVVEGSTTSDLARRLDISGATVSEHVAVLRDVGLISSRRHRNRVRHVATEQGRCLLGDLVDDFVRIVGDHRQRRVP